MLPKIEVGLRVAGLTVKRFLDWVEDSLKLKEEDKAAIYRAVGKKCSDKGKVDSAINSLSKAVELNSEYAESHYKLGLAHAKKGNHEDATHAFNKVIELSKNNGHAKEIDISDVYYRLGLCYGKQDKVDNGIEMLIEALKITDDNAKTHFQLGLLYDKARKHGESIKAYKTAIELDPQREKYYYSLGLAYEANGEHDKSIEAFRMAMETEEPEE